MISVFCCIFLFSYEVSTLPSKVKGWQTFAFCLSSPFIFSFCFFFNLECNFIQAIEVVFTISIVSFCRIFLTVIIFYKRASFIKTTCQVAHGCCDPIITSSSSFCLTIHVIIFASSQLLKGPKIVWFTGYMQFVLSTFCGWNVDLKCNVVMVSNIATSDIYGFISR